MHRAISTLGRVLGWAQSGQFLWGLGGGTVVATVIGWAVNALNIAPLPVVVLFSFGVFCIAFAAMGQLARRFLPVDQGRAQMLVSSEWATANRFQHYDGVKGLVREAQTLWRSTVAMTDPTVRDQSVLRRMVDSVDLQASAYADTWGGSYWSQHQQDAWRREGRYVPVAPAWAGPLWERIDYAAWWLTKHDPMNWEYDSYGYPES